MKKTKYIHDKWESEIAVTGPMDAVIQYLTDKRNMLTQLGWRDLYIEEYGYDDPYYLITGNRPETATECKERIVKEKQERKQKAINQLKNKLYQAIKDNPEKMKKLIENLENEDGE